MNAVRDWLSDLNHRRLSARGEAMLNSLERQGPVFLDPQELAGIDLAIVGPASTVQDELLERPLPENANICRINNGVQQSSINPALYGDRTFLWIHNLTTEGERSAGAITRQLLQSHDVHFLMYPHAMSRGHIGPKLKAMHEIVKASEIAAQPRVPNVEWYQSLRSELGGHIPTAGCVAIALALSSPLRSLSIYGFTFFTTRYVEGYKDQVDSNDKAMNWATQTQLHDPSAEAKWVAQHIDRHQAEAKFPIYLGKGVSEALLPHRVLKGTI